MSMAAPKSVLPPHGALARCATFFFRLHCSSITTHEGWLSKVSMRSRNSGWVTSLMRIPSAIDTSIGSPDMLPLTSQSGTSLPSPPDTDPDALPLPFFPANLDRRSRHCASMTRSGASPSSPPPPYEYAPL